MKPAIYTFIIFICAFAAGGCNKLAGPANAGLGGTSEIMVMPTNALSGYVDSCIVYIKYNATQAPGNSQYDDSAKCVVTNGVPVATFSNLKVGNYYLHSVGYESALTPSTVSGGEAFNIQQPGTFDVYLPTLQGL
jgi:hypothetical protein